MPDPDTPRPGAPSANPASAIPASGDRPGPDQAPETYNPKQDDEGSQAQSVSGDAYFRGGPGLGETVKVPTGDPSDDVPDLVDHMRQMDRSGRIDMSAYAGERNDDEEEGRYGSAAEED